jgi:hypothetical protein
MFNEKTLTPRPPHIGKRPPGWDVARRVYGTRKWVGTTEVVSLLRHYGVRANIVGFKTDSQAAKDAYGQRFIFDWVWDYFTGGCVAWPGATRRGSDSRLIG